MPDDVRILEPDDQPREQEASSIITVRMSTDNDPVAQHQIVEVKAGVAVVALEDMRIGRRLNRDIELTIAMPRGQDQTHVIVVDGGDNAVDGDGAIAIMTVTASIGYRTGK